MDSVRGWSSLVVACAHAFQVFVLPKYGLYGLPHLLSSWLACYSVMAFFVVSGFMISLSVNRHRRGGAGFDQGGFLRARVLRIYPPLLASVALCAVVVLLFRSFGIHGSDSFRLGDEPFLSRERVEMGLSETASTVLLAYNIVPRAPGPIQLNGPLWTLSYEWWFYLLAMFTASALVERRLVLGLLPALGIVGLFALSGVGALLWPLLAVWGCGFALGCAHLRGLLERPRAPAVIGAVALVAVAGIFAIGRGDTIALVIEPLQRLGTRAHWTMCLVSIVGACILAALVRVRWHGVRCGRLAIYSYTLYLVHYPLMLLMFGLLHPRLHAMDALSSVLAAGASVLAVLPVARAIARVVEDRSRIGAAVDRLAGILGHG